MTLYLVNIGLIVSVLVALALVTLRIREARKRDREFEEFQMAFRLSPSEELESLERRVEQFKAYLKSVGSSEEEAEKDAIAYRERMIRGAESVAALKQKVSKIVSWIYLTSNITTTILALIPIGFAVYHLLTNNQRQALNFNLAALGTLIITKGGLLVAVVLIPALKAVPGGMGATAGGIVFHRMWNWFKGRRKKSRRRRS